VPNEPIANSPLVPGGLGPASALTSKDAKTGEWVMQRNFPALHDPLSFSRFQRGFAYAPV